MEDYLLMGKLGDDIAMYDCMEAPNWISIFPSEYDSKWKDIEIGPMNSISSLLCVKDTGNGIRIETKDSSHQFSYDDIDLVVFALNRMKEKFKGQRTEFVYCQVIDTY